MADEQSKPTSGGSKRRRRRRSSRNRKRSNQPKSDAPNAPSGQKSGDDSSAPSRRRRRRRRSRSRSSQSQRQEQAPVRDMLDAKLPESIFVYTHVLRSSELDTYGFRPDPFLNRSRSLGDFRIDLTPLFPQDAEGAGSEEERIFDAALHGPIVTSLADALDEEENGAEETGNVEGPDEDRDNDRDASDDE